MSNMVYYIPVIALYPEVHFRFFRFFPSLLYKKEPEIIFDAPSRLEPDETLPLFLIINDINLFKIDPIEVAVTISQVGGETELLKFNELERYEIKNLFSCQQRTFVFTISKEKIPYGQFFVNALLTFKKGKKIYKVLNDNINTSSKFALTCYRATSSLPGRKEGLCCYGDLHFHTQYSQSHVEFGPPLKAIDCICKASGLSFVGLTDHSYDLSCNMQNYLKEDRELGKWKSLLNELKTDSFCTIFLVGEEVSCRNSRDEIVHLVTLNNREFIAGSHDGARKKIIFMKDYKIDEVVDFVHKQDGIAFAAHPASQYSLLERVLLQRGNWSEEDLSSKLDGIQFFNGGFDRAWESGKILWIKMINKGHRISLVAGNDSHGDFNRYRAIKFPFLSIYEDLRRYMGYGKTGIYGECKNKEGLINSIQKGNTFITTGPYISVNSSQNPKDTLVSKDGNSSVPKLVYIHLISSDEYGHLKKVSLFEGTNDPSIPEKKVFEKHFNEILFEAMIPIEWDFCGNYIRAELETTGRENKDSPKAFTSCCWLR